MNHTIQQKLNTLANQPTGREPLSCLQKDRVIRAIDQLLYDEFTEVDGDNMADLDEIFVAIKRRIEKL